MKSTTQMVAIINDACNDFYLKVCLVRLLEVIRIKPENGREMSSAEFLRGYVKTGPYTFGESGE